MRMSRVSSRRAKHYRILGCRITLELNRRGKHRVIVESGSKRFASRWHPSMDAAMRQALQALHVPPAKTRPRVPKSFGPLIAATLTTQAGNGR
jgi:hypothetical protein